jgi:rod shape determining protein RodA
MKSWSMPWSMKGQRPQTGWRSILSLRVPWWRLDWPILFLGVALLALGLLFVHHIGQADELLGRRDVLGGRQVQKTLMGLPFLVLGLLVRPRWLRRNAYLVYGLALVLLCLVPILGEERNGARRWIPTPISSFDLQPSEFVKVAMIVALARALYRNRLQRARDWRVPGLLALAPIGLVAVQPDLGTALTLVPVSLGLCWIAGARTRVLVSLVLAVTLAGWSAWRFELVHGYQKKRIDTWVSCLDSQTLIENKNGAAYHTYMARVFIGNGGATGTGLGRGVANESGNLPERECDSIFAVIAAEGGFVGASALVAAYLSFAAMLLVAAGRTRERFSRLVVAGAGLYFAAHFAINAGVNLGLLPMTGLTLPLISTGGSSLLASLALFGLALGLSARAEPALDSDSFRD